MALKPSNIFSRIAAWWFLRITKGCLGCFLLQVFFAGFAPGLALGFGLLLIAPNAFLL